MAEFNMAAEIRSVLESNKSLTGKEVLAALKKKFPRQKINENSFGNAYSTQRRNLGIRGNKKTKRKKPATNRKSASAPVEVNFEALRAAKACLIACGGDADAVITAIRQLKQLQV